MSYEPPEINGSYCRSALARRRRFDIIVIDGANRNNCARHCITALERDGVVIWDNADWEHRLRRRPEPPHPGGLSKDRFRGHGPLNGYGWSTAILYRPTANCQGI
jgi:hypothetical protein